MSGIDAVQMEVVVAAAAVVDLMMLMYAVTFHCDWIVLGVDLPAD